MVTWVVVLSAGLLIGLAAGMFFGHLDMFGKKQTEELKGKLEAAEKELASYKMEVAEHFLVTASLVNSMTESYQAVHEHLAKSANRLCDSSVNVNRLKVNTNTFIKDGVEIQSGDKSPKESEQILSDASQLPIEAPETGQTQNDCSEEDAVKQYTSESTPAESGLTPGESNFTPTKADPTNADPTNADTPTKPDVAPANSAPMVLAASQVPESENMDGVDEHEQLNSGSVETALSDTVAIESGDSDHKPTNPQPKAASSSKTTPVMNQQGELVEPPSTPESLSLDEEDFPGPNRTVH